MNWWNEHLLAITESRRLKVSIGLTLLNNLPLEQLDHLAAQVDLTDETSKLTINWKQTTTLAPSFRVTIVTSDNNITTPDQRQ